MKQQNHNISFFFKNIHRSCIHLTSHENTSHDTIHNEFLYSHGNILANLFLGRLIGFLAISLAITVGLVSDCNRTTVSMKYTEIY